MVRRRSRLSGPAPFATSSRKAPAIETFFRNITIWIPVGVGLAARVGSWLSLKLYLARGPYERASGIVVKNYIDQSQEFVLCAVALAYPAMALLRTKRIWLAALLAAIALSFLVNMMFVVISRTALVTMPIMLAVFALL